MNLINTAPEWTTTLKHMAAGATIATVLLVPPVSSPAIRIQSQSTGEPVRLVTSVPDGLFDTRMVRFRTRTGLSAAYPLIDQSDDEEAEDPVFLPLRLREASGLSVTTLAQLAGVSKVTYHKWLKGEGISETNASRLAGLLGTLRELRDLRGEGLSEFLETRGSLGRPIELLQRGDVDVVLGLALRTDNAPPPQPVVTDAVWETSGLEGWIKPVASLTWDAPRLTDVELGQALMEANPRPWGGVDMAMSESDESPFVAHVQFVS